MNMGCDVACKAEAAKPTNAQNIWKFTVLPIVSVSFRSNQYSK
jgi:hypothetical protein